MRAWGPVRQRSQLPPKGGLPIIGRDPVGGKRLKKFLHLAANACHLIYRVDLLPEVEQHREVEEGVFCGSVREDRAKAASCSSFGIPRKSRSCIFPLSKRVAPEILRICSRSVRSLGATGARIVARSAAILSENVFGCR